MEEYIAISSLNDFIFCPYSIYLHNVYMDVDEDNYKAQPQMRGQMAHQSIDKKQYSTLKNDIMSLPVFSEQLGVMGKIDLYKVKERSLIERKYSLAQIFQGQIYQLWAQYVCMVEMGYEVERLLFYEISKNRSIPIALPTQEDITGLKQFIYKYRSYDPGLPFVPNKNKCLHCIYSNLCDKTDIENVYS